jgi:hypothetical protein
MGTQDLFLGFIAIMGRFRKVGVKLLLNVQSLVTFLNNQKKGQRAPGEKVKPGEDNHSSAV